MAKTFKEFMTEASTSVVTEGTQSMRDWVIHQIEKTDRPHDEILADFKKKFGKDKIKEFDKIVSEIVD